MAHLLSFQLSSLPRLCLSIRLVIGMASTWASLVTANVNYATLCSSGHCLADKLAGHAYHPSLALAEREWIGTPIPLERPTIYIGSEKLATGIDAEYLWSYFPGSGEVQRGTFLASKKPNNMPSLAKYAALAWIFNADVYWGQLVMLRADVELIGVWGYASLFVHIFNERSGNTIALDNMRDRRIQQNGRFSVVVAVPDPRVGNGNTCPATEFIPDLIQVGFQLSGGLGFVEMTGAEFGLTTGPITGGPPPWVGPPAMVGHRTFLP